MAEVRLEAELTHPPERVWRALTDARLLSEWFLPTDLTPVAGSRFTLSPDRSDPVGFSGPVAGEVVEAVPARRLVMLWQGQHLHTRVVWELEQTAGGCRLLIIQSGFVGTPATVRQRALRAAYQRFVAERLPPVLDRLGSPVGAADRGAPAGAAVVPRPRQPFAEEASANGPRAGSKSHAVTFTTAVTPADAGRLGPASAAGPGTAGSLSAAAASSGPERERSTGEGPVSGGLVLYSPVTTDPLADAPVADHPGADTVSPPAAEETGAEPVVDGGPRPRGAWRDWLAVVPAWGRALVLAVLGAVLAVVVLSGITNTWTPWPDAGTDPGADDLRQGPGLAVQPGDGAARTTPQGAGDGADPAGGSGAPPDADGAPEGGEDSDRSLRPVLPGQVPRPDRDEPGVEPEPAPELTAVMTTSTRLLGLSGRAVSVTVSNPGPGEAVEWQVTMEVGGQDVTNISGAAYERSGSVAVFTPLGDGPAAGESLQFSFDIPGGLLGLGGATDPTDCKIDDRACG